MCLQHRGVERPDEAGHLRESSFSQQHRPLPHCAVFKHRQQCVCFGWEVSQSRVKITVVDGTKRHQEGPD